MSPDRHPLIDGLPEPWATEWGGGRYGPFLGFTVEGVTQRMRWVPAGRFLMGSTESEAGRRDEEGPQHEVTISKGFWLADTPCTQALWEAVMGNNPSCFKSPTRPVEQVSWDDCQSFLGKLNGLVPGLDARLPTEAEWEYACRAGTTTATWVGDLEIMGHNNAPVLDAIAWYGGNSGHGFELDDGHESSGWPQRQYPHTKAGTRPVAQKRPNPLGLYDMLGNVWEWCQDWYGPYSATLAADPHGPRSGSDRVFRGGSWFDYARPVRAACRRAHDPSNRSVDLGFRLARGQAPSAGRSPGRPAGGAAGRGQPARDAPARPREKKAGP